MKKALIFVVVIVLLVPVLSFANDRVRGYWKDTNRDGVKDTYVQPYERTSPNNSRTDNYSYPGNYNPNSGRHTPQSSSPRELYPYNPSPYETKQQRSW
jgi:hypothetical protein